jgi:hypothetical protein
MNSKIVAFKNDFYFFVKAKNEYDAMALISLWKTSTGECFEVMELTNEAPGIWVAKYV